MKKIYTREEFESAREQWAEDLDQNQELQDKALDVFVAADKHNWIHQTTWMGEPSLQTPEDLITFQEIIFKTRPEYLVEVGVAWAGSLLFYATIMEAIGKGKIIGIDIFMPDDLKERIMAHPLSHRIELLNVSSIDSRTLELLKEKVKGTTDVMVHLDSDHTCEHVLKELKLYQSLVGEGHYMVCGDTIIEYFPDQKHRPREWSRGNSPKTALDLFLEDNDRFEVDRSYDKKRLMSNQPGGYLKCTKQ